MRFQKGAHSCEAITGAWCPRLPSRVPNRAGPNGARIIRYAIGLQGAAHGIEKPSRIFHIFEDIQAEDGIERSAALASSSGASGSSRLHLHVGRAQEAVGATRGGAKGSFSAATYTARFPDQLAGDVSYPRSNFGTSSPTWGRIFSCQPAQIPGACRLDVEDAPGRRGPSISRRSAKLHDDGQGLHAVFPVDFLASSYVRP